MGLLTDDVRAHIGRTVTYHSPDPVSRAAIRYFATAIGDDNPLYRDAGAARAVGLQDVIAPPTFVCETTQYTDRMPNEDGYAGHEWDLPLPPTRVLRGGHEYEFIEPVYPDTILSVTWTIEDMVEKVSSSGRRMLIITSLAEFHDQQGQLLVRNRETIIHQERP
jgi:acyl dehydratase